MSSSIGAKEGQSVIGRTCVQGRAELQYFDVCRMQVSSRFFGNQCPMQNPNVNVMIDDTSRRIVMILDDKLRLDRGGKFSGASALGRKDSVSSLLAMGYTFQVNES